MTEVQHEWIRNLKDRATQLAEAGISFTVPAEVTQADQSRERRWLRMRSAGSLFPAAMQAAMGPLVARPGWHEVLVEGAKAFVRDVETYSLILSAPPGRGKSWAATWIVAETLDRSVWVGASEVRVGWDLLRQKALKASLLVVDDLGEESSGEWGVRELATLLESRHNAGQRTVVTTNLMPAEIASRYGERLISRWSQTPYSRLVLVRGEDLRRA